MPLRNRLGGLPQRLAFWAAEAFDFAPDPRVTSTLHTRRLARWFLTGNMAALGGAYVSGELATDGRIEDALLLGIGIAERVGRSRLADWAACPQDKAQQGERRRRCPLSLCPVELLAVARPATAGVFGDETAQHIDPAGSRSRNCSR